MPKKGRVKAPFKNLSTNPKMVWKTFILRGKKLCKKDAKTPVNRAIFRRFAD